MNFEQPLIIIGIIVIVILLIYNVYKRYMSKDKTNTLLNPLNELHRLQEQRDQALIAIDDAANIAKDKIQHEADNVKIMINQEFNEDVQTMG